jgi:hypothetical protein
MEITRDAWYPTRGSAPAKINLENEALLGFRHDLL